jgi:multidrug efflux pump subunit AcrB
MVKVLHTIPEVQSVFVLGGSTPTGGLEVRKSSLFIHLAPKTERTLPQKALKVIISDKLADVPDTRAWYVNERGDRQLSFSMLSHDGDTLSAAIGKLESALRQVPGFKNVAANAAIDRPELRVVPKFDAAARLGVAPSQIAETIRVATIGDIAANLAKFNAGDRLVPIRVQIEEDARTDYSGCRTARHQHHNVASRPRRGRRRSGAGRARSAATTASAAPRSVSIWSRATP